MNSKNFLIALLVILSFSKIYSEPQNQQNSPVEEQKQTNELDNHAHCYCSEKCGPRNIEPKDEIFVVVKDPNKEYIYCALRDVLNYKPHNCAQQNQEKQASNNDQ